MPQVTVMKPRFHIELGELEEVRVRSAVVRSEMHWAFERAAFDREEAEANARELATRREHVRIVDRGASDDRTLRERIDWALRSVLGREKTTRLDVMVSAVLREVER